MAANTDPIYSRVADDQWAPTITAANTAKDGTGTVSVVFLADATNGGYVGSVAMLPIGSNVASVARLFENNGGTNATAGNNTLIAEQTLNATTLSEVAQLQSVSFPIGRALPPGYRLLVTLGTAVAAGWTPSTFGGKY